MRAIQSICLMFMMMLVSYAAPAAESGSTTLTGEGWTIETQGDRGRLTIKHERLGTILREVRLNLEANGAVQEMPQWKAEVTGPVVHTSSSRGETKQWTPESGITGRLLVEVLDLKVAGKAGTYDVVALPNWRSATATKDLSLSRQLGLEPGEKYVVFDFWNQALLGVVSDRISVEVKGHDTRVLLVHRLLSRPQLIGTSRHITGAYSIEDLAWNEKTNTLQGRSETVPGADYTLFFHLPPGTPPTVNVTATAGGNPLTVRQERTGDLLSVTFKSQQSPVA
jgi:hypothetical protein